MTGLDRFVRWLGIALGVIGGALAAGSVVMGILAKTTAQTLVWLAPEVCGLLLLVVGLHAWIDWGTD